MNLNHTKWIKENPSEPHICYKVTREMLRAFPELWRVHGYYYCWILGKRKHWWLTDGNVVIDPTASQFPSKGEGRYEECHGEFGVYHEPM